MQSSFSNDFFAGNRQRLRALFTGTAPIVITANGVIQRGGDVGFAFVQDASFWYLTGIDEPDVILVIDRDKEYLIVPERDGIQEAFNGAIDDGYLSRQSGIQELYKSEAGWEKLESRLKKVKHAATIAAAPAYLDHFALYTSPARATLVQRMKSANPSIDLLDLSPHLNRLRMVKQPVEIAAIQRAVDITTASMKQAFRPGKLRKYSHEFELEAELTYGFRKRGARGNAFEPVVASGERSCIMHTELNAGPFSADELVVVDVGAEYDHYAADIARTKSLGGNPTRRQIAIHSAVMEVQDYAFGLLKPDVILREYERQIEHFMGEKLRELGLIKTIDRDAIRSFFPHATSHFLGLNPHDAGEYDRPLEPGVVLVVEPGIYVPNESIGVRIEDAALITKTGVKNLSSTLSREL